MNTGGAADFFAFAHAIPRHSRRLLARMPVGKDKNRPS